MVGVTPMVAPMPFGRYKEGLGLQQGALANMAKNAETLGGVREAAASAQGDITSALLSNSDKLGDLFGGQQLAGILEPRLEYDGGFSGPQTGILQGLRNLGTYAGAVKDLSDADTETAVTQYVKVAYKDPQGNVVYETYPQGKKPAVHPNVDLTEVPNSETPFTVDKTVPKNSPAQRPTITGGDGLGFSMTAPAASTKAVPDMPAEPNPPADLPLSTTGDPIQQIAPGSQYPSNYTVEQRTAEDGRAYEIVSDPSGRPFVWAYVE